MAIREKLIQHIQKKTGNENADLWTLQFNESDADVSIEDISFRGVAGNVRLQEGKLRTNKEVERDARKIISHWHLK